MHNVRYVLCMYDTDWEQLLYTKLGFMYGTEWTKNRYSKLVFMKQSKGQFLNVRNYETELIFLVT